MKLYLQNFKHHYASYDSRLDRRSYWLIQLYQALGLIIAILIDFAILYLTGSGHFTFISLIYFMVTLLPSICATIRRLRDTGKSGKWLFIVLVPFLGPAILLVLLLKKSKPSEQVNDIKQKLRV